MNNSRDSTAREIGRKTGADLGRNEQGLGKLCGIQISLACRIWGWSISEHARCMYIRAKLWIILGNPTVPGFLTFTQRGWSIFHTNINEKAL